MYHDLKNKNAVITGSGKRNGIGFAIARELARNGVNVVIADLGKGTIGDTTMQAGQMEEMNILANELKREYGINAYSFPCDVTSTYSINEFVTKVTQVFESVHILCNNAGATFGVPSAIHTYDEQAWLKTIDVNLHGTFRVSRAIVPLMKNGGSIINTASRAGKFPAMFNGAYSVAKAGVIMLTKVMAKELAGAGIRVNAVCPGQINTDLERWRFELEAKIFNTTPEEREKVMCQSIPIGRIGTPQEVARLVAYLASDASSYITGQAINVCGGQLMEL
ncbi:MAG: SDR family oxidoreductase [Spirochaetes bacterium]|nr:SDR family oxidoreductase [Spirochaetota bacterium]